MRAVDTNVLVRLLTHDDADQLAAAEAFVANGAWVSTLVLAEAIWVLDAVYERRPAEIASAVEMLLDHATLVLDNRAAVAAALAGYRRRPTLGFSDCLVLELARAAGHVPLGTFDRTLAGLEGAQRLPPPRRSSP